MSAWSGSVLSSLVQLEQFGTVRPISGMDGWDGMGWDGMGWDGMDGRNIKSVLQFSSYFLGV